MPSNEPQLTKAERREAARANALKLQEEQLRRERRSRITILSSVVAGLLVVGVIVVMILRSAGPDVSGATEFPEGIARPSVADDTGGVSFGPTGEAGTSSPEGAVNVDVYLDYMCPICGSFEQVNSDSLDELREAGDITLTIHAISILDGASKGSAYSTRSANAFAYIAQNAPDKALAFSEALFAQQPKENTTGLTDDQLVSIAQGVGVPDDVAKGITTLTYKTYVKAATEIASNTPALRSSDGSFGTPTILVDGKRTSANWTQPGALAAEIADLKK